MSESPKRREVSMWRGAEFIPELFAELYPESANMSITAFLNEQRVIVKYDPVLIAVFGREVVDQYEAMLEKRRNGDYSD